MLFSGRHSFGVGPIPKHECIRNDPAGSSFSITWKVAWTQFTYGRTTRCLLKLLAAFTGLKIISFYLRLEIRQTMCLFNMQSPENGENLLRSTVWMISSKLESDLQTMYGMPGHVEVIPGRFRLMLHLVFGFPEEDEIVLLKFDTVSFLVFMFSFVIREWTHFRHCFSEFCPSPQILP